MHKKIRGYIFISALYCSWGVIFGMQQEKIIPVLSINNYIVPVSSAYQALFKEASFKQRMLRDMINTANTAAREKLAGKMGIVHQIADEREVERLIDPNIFYLRIPCFRYMELTYKNASEFECSNDMDADVKIVTFQYYISPTRFNSREYMRKEKSITHISTVVKNNIMHVLPKGTSAYIELYSPGQISDWIKITNCFKSTDHAVVRQDQEQSLFHARDIDDKLIIDSYFDVNINFCPLIFGVTVIAAMLVRGMLY